MCGLVALLSCDPERQQTMHRMLAALAHRGPDGEGQFVDDHVALGHRRLSIIDLSGGTQPLHNHERTLWLVCNGEIYNHRELRRQLLAQGYRFRTQSDCEVILALYERYQENLLQHLRGMFAFALWDVSRRRLLIARDHLGQKPLFYSYDRGVFACASEIKALLARTDAVPRMNFAAFDQYLALRLIDAPWSMFEGIHKLPPAHFLMIESGREPVVKRYWSLSREPKQPMHDEDALVDALEGHIAETLQLHLESDVPVGAFLSGGMDSGLLVSMLCKKLGVQRPSTFTMGLAYQRFDEAPHARSLASLLQTNHHEGVIEPSLVSLVPDLLWALDEPSDPLSLCMWHLARFARQHVKVVIGGDGGDELFAGYDRYQGQTYASYYGKVPVAVRRKLLEPAFALLPKSGWYKSVGHQVRWLHHLSFHNGSARYAASLTYFYFDAPRRWRLYTAESRERAHELDAEASLRAAYDETSGDELDRMLAADTIVRLPNHPVMITDRMSMAHGLEVRSPFMDHKLAEFAASLPTNSKIRAGTLRYIQRKLAARYLPLEAIRRPKQGFSSALPYLLQREYTHLYDACLRHSSLVADHILDGAAISELLGQHLHGRSDHGNRLWLLINAELWYRMYVKQQSREDLRGELTATYAVRASRSA